MAFSKLVSKAVQTGSIKDLIKGAYVGVERKVPLTAEPTSPNDYPNGWVRVSNMATTCAREEVLKSRLKVVGEFRMNPDLGVTFLHGTALHWGLQNKLLPKLNIFRGMWSCNGCGLVSGGVPKGEPFDSAAQILRPSECSRCRCQDHTYVEQWFGNAEYRIGGSQDGYITMPGMQGLGVFEAKSIASHAFYEVKNCPSYDHVIQLQCYMWLTGLQWGKILYWDKGGQGLSSLCEHTIDRDEDTIEAVQKVLRDMWAGIASEDAPLPERSMCANAECPRAQKCPVAKQCFETPDGVL